MNEARVRRTLFALAPLLVAVAIVVFAPAAAAEPPVQKGTDAGLSAILAEFVSRWALFVLGAGIIVLAFLVNRFAPKRKSRVRRVVILFLLYLVSLGVAAAFNATHLEAWATNVHFVASLFAAWTTVNMAALLFFDVGLPAFKVQPVSITTDILVGLAYVVSTGFVLKTAGVNTGSVLTTGAVVSGFVALSLQNTLSNIFGGLALQLDNSIHVGDWIMLENGRQGRVREVRWRHTVVETRDWDTMVVPNSALLSEKFTILGKRDGAPLQHRMWVYFNVDFRYSPAKVIKVVNDALQAAPIERVALDPKPHAIVMDFAKDNRDSFAYYAVRYWLTEIAVDDPTNSVIRTRIYHALRRAGIPLARAANTTFLQLDDDSAHERRLGRQHQQRLAAIRGMELFAVLNPTELEFVASRMSYAPFTVGEMITREGAVAHWLYVLATGSVDIRANIEGSSKTIARIEGPGFFGEMGLMTGEPRLADVVATSEVECYRLDKTGFQKIIEERPEIAKQMSETLAERRVELIAAREGLDAEAKKARVASLRDAILGKVEKFFGLGLGSTSIPPKPPK